MATMISAEQARATALEKRQLLEDKIVALTSGIDTSKINLKVNRGNKYLGIVFNSDGSPAYKEDPDDGTRLMVKLMGDSGWQFTDALYGAWKSVPDGKLMAWQWSDVEKSYVPSRTVYIDNVPKQPAGILDQLVERKLTQAVRTSLPGLAELGFLSGKISDIVKAVKADKEHVKKGLAVFTPATKSELVRYMVLAAKGVGMDKSTFLKLLAEYWPELFKKEETQHK